MDLNTPLHTDNYKVDECEESSRWGAKKIGLEYKVVKLPQQTNQNHRIMRTTFSRFLSLGLIKEQINLI